MGAHKMASPGAHVSAQRAARVPQSGLDTGAVVDDGSSRYLVLAESRPLTGALAMVRRLPELLRSIRRHDLGLASLVGVDQHFFLAHVLRSPPPTCRPAPFMPVSICTNDTCTSLVIHVARNLYLTTVNRKGLVADLDVAIPGGWSDS